MGKRNAPINEARYILNELEPGAVDEIRTQFPGLAEELKGIMGGVDDEQEDTLDEARARVHIRALTLIKDRTEKALPEIWGRIVGAKKLRLGSAVVTAVCGSGALASFALAPAWVQVLAELLTLLGAVGVLIAEYKEATLGVGGDGNIHDVYKKISDGTHNADMMAQELTLLVVLKAPADKLQAAIAQANELARNLNGWLTGALVRRANA